MCKTPFGVETPLVWFKSQVIKVVLKTLLVQFFLEFLSLQSRDFFLL